MTAQLDEDELVLLVEVDARARLDGDGMMLAQPLSAPSQRRSRTSSLIISSPVIVASSVVISSSVLLAFKNIENPIQLSFHTALSLTTLTVPDITDICSITRRPYRIVMTTATRRPNGIVIHRDGRSCPPGWNCTGTLWNCDGPS